MRLFLALMPPPSVRDACAALSACLAWPGRRIAPERLHLTVVFLGEVGDASLASLRDVLDRQVPPGKALVLDRLGWFPRARVGWLGCTGPPPAWTDFRRRLVKALDGAGLPGDRRRWAPHVTLYRDLRTPPEMMPFDAVTWRPDGLSLVRSVQGPGIVEYRVLGHWPARGADEGCASP